ncbi:DUF2786 domain-containing protein [Streptomyces polyrhachis]|uniref:DUF2786 domain-containing protein n=1 Tax=Streptomyces polyrhachis TaxID=1282885 RepID=A0ABW2GIX2_9ACTN
MGKRSQERRRARQGQHGGPAAHGSRGSHGQPPQDAAPPRTRSLAEELAYRIAAVAQAPEECAERETTAAASWLFAAEEQVGPLGRAVLADGERRLEALWRRGWQPADVVRVARRELGPVHTRVAVDLIAAEARRYPAAGLDRRWAAQLAEAGAEPWWGADEEWLPALPGRQRSDRFLLAVAVFELLRLLFRLPALEVLCTPPGTGAAVHAARPASPGAARTLGRIRALLAKAESTEFPEEAEALTAKAQQLMAEHSIGEALLAARGAAHDAPAGIRLGVESPYEQPKAALLHEVAEANRCRAVWSKELGFSTVVGFEADLDAVELLYTSLLVQATAALGAEGARAGGGSRRRAFRASFLSAYAARIGERLGETTAAATARAAGADGTTDGAAADGTAIEGAGAAGSPLLPVLAARHRAVEEEADRIFPAVTRSRASAVSDWEGWTSGRAAADRAGLRAEGGRLPAG